METVEDREEEIEVDFVEAEVVRLAVVVEVSLFVWSLWFLVPLGCMTFMSPCLHSVRQTATRCLGSSC